MTACFPDGFRSRFVRTGLPTLLAALLLTAGAAARAQDPTPTAAGPVRISAAAEPKQVSIGDPIRYTVTVTAKNETEILFPVLAGQIGDFSITDFGELPPQRNGSELTVGRWYTLTVWETGDHLVPAPEVHYRVPGEELATAEGNEVLVGVTSLLGADPDKAELKDIRPPIEPPFDWKPWGVLAAVLALIGLLAFAFYWFVTRPKRKPAIPPRPPFEIALEGLSRLRGQKLIEAGRFEEYYVALSAVVRRYLEDGFALRAPEMTTEEFLVAASSDKRLAAAHRRMLGDFLAQADLVKFARFRPNDTDAEAAYEAAKRFVEETRPRPTSEEASRAAA